MSCCKQDKAIWKYGEKTDGNNFIAVPNRLVLMKLLFRRIKEQVVFFITDASSSIIFGQCNGFPTCLNGEKNKFTLQYNNQVPIVAGVILQFPFMLFPLSLFQDCKFLL